MSEEARTLNTITREELNIKISRHKNWLETNKTVGEPSNLSNIDFRDHTLTDIDFDAAILNGSVFQEMNLSNVSFKGARLKGAQFQRASGHSTQFQSAELQGANFEDSQFDDNVVFESAKLNRANFDRANLRKAKFGNADVFGASFDDTDLTDAKFDGVIGVSERQFAGAILTGCSLPEAIRDFQGLSNVQEVTETGRKLFVALMLGCIYALLTIIGTETVSFLTDSVDSVLPIFQAKVKIVEFFQYSPLVLLFTYLWFHLYLLKNYWHRLNNLPAYFPGGIKMDERIFPWHFGGLILKHFPHLRELELSFESKAQYVLSLLAFWFVVPFMLAYFWLRYLVIHDWATTSWHAALLVIAICLGWACFISAIKKVRRYSGRFHKFWWQDTSRWVKSISVLCLVSCLGVVGLSLGAISGWLTWSFVVADFKNADLAGLDLSGRNLKNANLEGAKLQNAILTRAKLNGADLTRASLVGANFERAELIGANLRHAQAELVNLKYAKLQYADLSGMSFKGDAGEGGSLFGADLRNAKLTNVNLHQVHVDSIRLDYAWLEGTNLVDHLSIGFDNLKNARTLYRATLTQEVRDSIDRFRNELLKKP